MEAGQPLRFFFQVKNLHRPACRLHPACEIFLLHPPFPAFSDRAVAPGLPADTGAPAGAARFRALGPAEAALPPHSRRSRGGGEGGTLRASPGVEMVQLLLNTSLKDGNLGGGMDVGVYFKK